MPGHAVVLVVLLGLLNLADIIIHIGVDQVEPLRVTSNIVVIVAAATMLAARSPRAIALTVNGALVLTLLVALVYLALNLVFIGLNSIGALGAALVTVTTVLLLVLAITLARARPARTA